MTLETLFKGVGMSTTLLVGLVHLDGEVLAQTSTESEAAGAEEDREAITPIDRGMMRLKLLITLVDNELQEATLHQSQLAVEASSLDQEHRQLLARPSGGSKAEKRRLAVIEERLEKIDVEMADINARLPEIAAERTDLQRRLDEANGVAQVDEETDGVIEATDADAGQWLDSKRRIQEALVYLGGYNALIDGDFGPRTREAIKVYQESRNIQQTGTLTEEQETALLEEVDRLRARYGMRTIEDRSLGLRVSYPSGLLPKVEEVAPDGRRYLSADGEGELLLTSSEDSADSDADDLTSIYQDLLNRYEVQYRRTRDGWFVVAGIAEDGRIVYDTARLVEGRTVRARLTYPAEWRDLWSPFAVIMFNSFEALSAGES